MMERKKVIYVAAAPPGEAAADLRRLGLLGFKGALRVIVPARNAAELESLTAISRQDLLPYSLISAAWLWARLIVFLGVSRDSEIIVFSPPGHSRLLKLLALTLRGRVSFSSGQGVCVPFSVVELLRAGWRQRFAARGPVCLIGTASAGSLQEILADLRRRYPDSPVHGVLPASLAESVAGFDSLDIVRDWGLMRYFRLASRCFGRGRFRRIILPWTNEQSSFRGLAWFLPLWRVEVYNEGLDAFPGRNLTHLYNHWRWQSRDLAEQRRRERIEYHRSLPVGVIGSASVFYLCEILLDLRKRYPGVRLHAILPQSLAAPANGLFDRVTVLQGSFFSDWLEAWRFAARNPHQAWIVPCTNEPYAMMKVLAFLLPLAPRQIYNELADGFAACELRTFYGHFRWRLRDHLSYQIVAGAAGSNRAAQLGHLVLYSGRLLAGAALLCWTRLRSRMMKGTVPPVPRVDLLLIGDQGHGLDFQDSVQSLPPALSHGSVRVVGVSGNGSLRQLNEAIRASAAEFVCLLDSECRLAPNDWLESLLSSFDDRTAQVGPELTSPDGETILRGLLFEARGGLVWNHDSAVRWHRRLECLEVDALPRLCVVFRRRVFAETGYFADDSCTMEAWADTEFSRRLRSLGWRSVCNRSVTATHPAVRLGTSVVAQEVTEGIQR